jgi:DNA repair exonuclease SbcCD ATPase subunit
MILKSYEVTNWGPHIHQKIEFPTGAKTIAICGENDMGKSWILNGIGFTLSPGRNSFGDQTSIHEGEFESHHKLVVEHNNQTYTIEKTVKNKNSEDEGTKTSINGIETDTAKFAEFYASLGMTMPSTWLPITISLQNQTDYHLRSKQRDREEALREICQLTRIDAWKDTLSQKTNEEDKTLIEQSATCKSKIESLSKELGKLLAEERELSAFKFDASQLITTEKTISIHDALPQIVEFETRSQKHKNGALELNNLQRELNLEENSLARGKIELDKLPGVSEFEQEKLESEKAALELEEKTREKEKLETKAFELLNTIRGKKKKILQVPITDLKIESLETALQKIETHETKLEIATNRLKVPKGNLQETQAQLTNLKTQLPLLQKNETLLRSLQTEIEEWSGLPLTCATSLKKTLEEKIKETAAFGTGPIGENEGQELFTRLLKHWENHDHCPVCNQDLPTNYQAPEKRERTLRALEKASIDKSQLQEEHLNAKSTLKSLEKWEGLTIQQNLLKNQVTEIFQPTESLEEIQKEIDRLQTLLKEIQDFEKGKVEAESLRNTLEKEKAKLHDIESLVGKSPSEIREILKTYKTQLQANLLLETEIRGLDREKNHFLEQLEKLTDIPAPQKPELDEATLQNKLAEIKQALQQAKLAKQARAQKQKEIQELEQKVKAKKEFAHKQNEILETLKTYLETRENLPHPNTENSAEDTIALWKEKEKKFQKFDTILSEIPPKKKVTEEELAVYTEQLQTIEARVQKAQAARKLIQFLDYKNAPRKLLQVITETVFTATNKIAESLDVQIKLTLGKNLEFLTHQKRGEKWIKQKTERLGYGKGAVLGICFRLACQKLLLPETGFLILDEPTANVDSKRKNALKNFIQRLSEETESQTKQIILIEHDLDVIERCDAKIIISTNEI